LLGIKEALDPNTLGVSCIVGAFKLGAFFGCFFGGAAMLRYGRIKAMAINGLFTTLGPIIMALSSGVG